MKNSYHKNNFPFYLLISLLVGAMFFYVMQANRERAHERRRKPPAEAPNHSVDQQFQKFALTGFDQKGKMFWKLEGERAKIDPGQAIFLDKDVTLKFKDNTVIRTDHVQWSPDSQTLRTDAPVDVDHESVNVKGVGAYGRPSENFIQLNRTIRMLINASTTLTCDGPMKIFYNENKMIFFRNVKVVDAKGILTSRRMDVFFDPEAKKIKQIIAVGKVVIERGVDTTRSKRAIYTVADGSIRLEGSPEITLHKNATRYLNGAFGN